MTFAPKNFTVWTEIMVTDLPKSVAFYNAVTDAGLTVTQDMGPEPMAVFKPADPATGVACHLVKGTPAGDGRGPVPHICAPGRAEDTAKRVEAAGGKVLSPVIEIPAGRFFYALDLDGNRLGFFEKP